MGGLILSAAAAAKAALSSVTLAQGAMLAGTAVSTVGAIKQGKGQQQAANFNADQIEAQGKAEEAVAQRETIEERRKKDMLISRARAVGGASGGGLDIDLLGEIKEEGEYNALTAQWQGTVRRKGRNAQAASSRFSGLAAKQASRWKAGSTLLHGASGFLQTRKPKAPKTFLSQYR